MHPTLGPSDSVLKNPGRQGHTVVFTKLKLVFAGQTRHSNGVDDEFLYAPTGQISANKINMLEITNGTSL